VSSRQPIPIQRENLERVHIDTSSLPRAKSRSLVAKFQRWYRCSGLRVLLLESRNLIYRIGWIREIHAVEHPGGKDSIRNWLARESVPWFPRYTPVYIDYMRETEFRFPFLSIFDLHLVSQASKAGLVYGIRTCTEQHQDLLCSLANPRER
jgi:hypothetical protein